MEDIIKETTKFCKGTKALNTLVVWILKLLIFLAEPLISGVIMAKKCPVLAENI